jgi:transposase
LPPRTRSWGFAGWSQASCSSGNRVHRGRLTKAGNAHLRAQLVESAWSYQHRPGVGVQIARRQQGLDPAVVARAWAAQQRLSGRFRTLAARKHTKSIVAAAIARELAGFLWAEMTA